MSARGRALLLACGGVVQVVAGLALAWLVPQATDDDALAWWLRLVTAWVALTGVVVTVAALRWSAVPGPQRGLPNLASVLGVLGVLAAVLGGLGFAVDAGPDAGFALVVGLMLTIPHAVSLLLASVIRRESAVAATGRPTLDA